MPTKRQAWEKIIEDVTMSPVVMDMYDGILSDWLRMGEYESISIDCTFLGGGWV